MSEHGTNSRYANGCRCDRCRAAHAAAARQQRSRDRQRMTRVTVEVVDSTGRVLRTRKFTLPRGEYSVRGRVEYDI